MHIDEIIQSARGHVIQLSNTLRQNRLQSNLNRSDLHLLIRSLSACKTHEEAISLLELWDEKLRDTVSVFNQSSVDKDKYRAITSYVYKYIIQKHSLHDSKEIIGVMSRLVN